jgi:ABC-type sugar transport system permease subunit
MAAEGNLVNQGSLRNRDEITEVRRTRFYRRTRWVEAMNGWLFVMPVVLGTLLLNILPALPNLYYSLTEWNGLTEPKWVGLDNYRELTTNQDFINSVRVTMIYVFTSVPLTMIAGLALALLVNRRLPGISVFRAIFYIPHIANLIAVAILFRYLLALRFGLINEMLWNVFNVQGPNWLGTSATAMGSVVLVSIYVGVGYQMVLFLAGLQNIPDHLYEAATIDGAGSWEKFRSITLPLLTPTIFFVLIITIIGSFNVFGLVFAMTDGGPGRATEVIFFLLYQQAFELYRFGFAAAMAVVMSVIVGLLTAVNWWLGKRWVFYG